MSYMLYAIFDIVSCICHIYMYLTLVAGSILGPLSQTHFSKSEFKNGHISRFCFVFQVFQVISSGKFFSAEEVDFSFISWIWIHESDFKGFFLEKRPWKKNSIQLSNSGINESTLQTQSNVIWIWSKAELVFVCWIFFFWFWIHKLARQLHQKRTQMEVQ